MTRRILLLAALLLTPASLAGQDTADRTNGADRSDGQSEFQVFLGTFQAIKNYGVSELSDSALWEKAIDGLIRELNDPYATVWTPNEYGDFQEQTTGDYEGIGVQITQLNNAITITAVFRRTPAQDAGLQVGDRILGVNGISTEGWTTADASDSIRGEPGTEVEILIGREGIARPIPHTIERNNVHISAVTLGRLPGNIGYMHLDRVARNSAEEVDSALTELADVDGIIVDLRRNPGGYLDESLAIADLFLDRGEALASTRSRARAPGDDGEEHFRARERAHVPGTPIVILVDRFTASAAEIISGALQDHDRALILGERTFGKGVVQSLIPLPGDRRLRLTTGEWLTPLGRSLHRPRDGQGNPLPENPDTFPTFESAGGRSLMGGGGVFPDLEIRDDTLLLAEREFLNEAANAQVPLALRLAEVAFEESQRYRQGEGPYDITDEAFQDLLTALEEAGIPGSHLAKPEVQDYLRLRARIQMADRLNDVGKATEIRAERDPVLTEALRLLRQAGDQQDLFAAVESRSSGTASDPAEGS